MVKAWKWKYTGAKRCPECKYVIQIDPAPEVCPSCGYNPYDDCKEWQNVWERIIVDVPEFAFKRDKKLHRVSTNQSEGIEK